MTNLVALVCVLISTNVLEQSYSVKNDVSDGWFLRGAYEKALPTKWVTTTVEEITRVFFVQNGEDQCTETKRIISKRRQKFVKKPLWVEEVIKDDSMLPMDEFKPGMNLKNHE